MTHEQFRKCLNELDSCGGATLAEKNARYSSSDDALHNFKCGAEIMGGTPAQACWGYATKHLTALRDMIERNDFSNRDDFLEKCQDTINYVRFIWAIGNEKYTENTNTKPETTSVVPFEQQECDECYYMERPMSTEPCCHCKHNKIYGTDEFETATSHWKERPYVANKQN